MKSRIFKFMDDYFELLVIALLLFVAAACTFGVVQDAKTNESNKKTLNKKCTLSCYDYQKHFLEYSRNNPKCYCIGQDLKMIRKQFHDK